MTAERRLGPPSEGQRSPGNSFDKQKGGLSPEALPEPPPTDLARKLRAAQQPGMILPPQSASNQHVNIEDATARDEEKRESGSAWPAQSREETCHLDKPADPQQDFPYIPPSLPDQALVAQLDDAFGRNETAKDESNHPLYIDASRGD